MLTAQSERSRIMRAAWDRLRRNEGLAVNDILESAGLSTRAFYRHFSSKDELILALVRRDSEGLLKRLAAAIDDVASPTEALFSWIYGMLQVTAQPKLRERVIVLSSAEAQGARGLAAERQLYLDEQTAQVIAILQSGLASGDFPWAEPTSDARYICAAVRESFETQMSGTASADAAEAARTITSFALRALGATAWSAASIKPSAQP